MEYRGVKAQRLYQREQASSRRVADATTARRPWPVTGWTPAQSLSMLRLAVPPRPLTPMLKRLEKFLPAIVVLSCLSFPLAIYFQLSPETRTRAIWVQDQFYYVLVAATVGLAFVAFYFAYKEFSLSRRPGVHLISLSFLLLCILLFATSLLGENVRPVLVDSFATHARLLFAVFFLAGVLASSEHPKLLWLRQVPTRTLNWITAIVTTGGILYAVLLRYGVGGQLTEETRSLLR